MASDIDALASQIERRRLFHAFPPASQNWTTTFQPAIYLGVIRRFLHASKPLLNFSSNAKRS
jgi:hypothetical protein